MCVKSSSIFCFWWFLFFFKHCLLTCVVTKEWWSLAFPQNLDCNPLSYGLLLPRASSMSSQLLMWPTKQGVTSTSWWYLLCVHYWVVFFNQAMSFPYQLSLFFLALIKFIYQHGDAILRHFLISLIAWCPFDFPPSCLDWR